MPSGRWALLRAMIALFVLWQGGNKKMLTQDLSSYHKCDFFVNLNADLPTDRHYVEIEIPDDISILELIIEDLPEHWDAKPPILETQSIGDDFVREKSAAVLKVPSCIVQNEFNYLINPNHPDSKKISVLSVTPLIFDNSLQQPKK